MTAVLPPPSASSPSSPEGSYPFKNKRPRITMSSSSSSSHHHTATTKSPDRGSIQRIAANALQTRNLTVERWPAGSLFRTFKLQPTSNPEFFYILRCRPSMSVRLLRHEEDRLQTEAHILQTLRGRSDVLVPRLIECQSTTAMIGSPYLISGPFKGVLLADAIEANQLSRLALASIERSMGTFVRRLTYISGTHFGPLGGSSSSSSASSYQSWSKCFAGMLESVLRDAEDALVSLPYDFIRDQVRRHRAALDQIVQPKLVVLELAKERNNIVVEPKTCTISGLLDFSTAVWGDPFMSDCFYNPSVGFVEGFGKLPNSTTEERIRQYLYILYHSLLAIVRQCYRPSEDGDELAARRYLTSALTQLNSIPR